MSGRTTTAKIKGAVNAFEEELKRDYPDEIKQSIIGAGVTVDTLFGGDGEMKTIRDHIKRVGYYTKGKRTLHVRTAPIEGSDDQQVVAIAAVARDPGRAETFLDTIDDYDPTGKSKAQLTQMYWGFYENEGMVNNAINKISAILSTGGQFKVRRAKQGKKQKTVETLEAILTWWVRHVNRSEEDGVITGARGLTAINQQAVRYALVEGDWVGRTVWNSAEVPEVGNFDLPINIQSISTEHLEAVSELAGTGAELFFWAPPREFINQLESPSGDAEKEIKNFVKRFVPSKVKSELVSEGKVLLEQALLMHVKNRGTDRSIYGESFIQPALPALAYKQAIERLDVVSMENLINRLTIVMVGSSDPESPYSVPTVASARADLMTTFFDDPGPNMTIIWQGDDIEVKDIGAHSTILELDGRHKIAEQKVKISLGVPEALLSGTSTDGKAAGWAAMMGASAELEELQSAFAMAWTTLGERIALQNNFTDVDLIFEFDQSLMVDRAEEMEQSRQDYVAGLTTIRDVLLSRGKDPDAVFIQRAFEKGLDVGDEATTWERVFMPPQGLQGQGDEGLSGAGAKPPSGSSKKNQEGNTTDSS